nr:NADH dehydrogenase subunit 4 [Strongylocotes lipogonus]
MFTEMLSMGLLCGFLGMSSFEICILGLGSMLLSSLTLMSGEINSFGFRVDHLSFVMVFLSIILGIMTILPSSKDSLNAKGLHMKSLVMFTVAVVLVFFTSDSLYVFFVSFELSIIPLMIIILSWGKQPERIGASKLMFSYTMVSSSFLLLLVAVVLDSGSSIMSFHSTEFNLSGIESPLLVFSLLTFFVKIPVFMFHSWLPKAHVEAPLEGSMLLAGLMLKVGLYGLIRFSEMSEWGKEMSLFIVVLGLWGALLTSVLSISSDDMKMSVAYSSVSHMNIAVSAFVLMKDLSLSSSLVIMFTHGLSSPLLFYLVTQIYDMCNSRSILVSKGVLSKLPFLSLVSFILWMVNISPPPFLSFFGELSSFAVLINLWFFTSFALIGYLFVSSFFNMVNYGILSHSSQKLNFKNGEGGLLLPLLCSSVTVSLVILFFWSSLINL